MFSSSEKDPPRSSRFLRGASGGSGADTSLCAGDEEHDFFSDASDSSCSSSCGSDVLPSLSESSPSSASSSSSAPLPCGGRRQVHGHSGPTRSRAPASQGRPGGSRPHGCRRISYLRGPHRRVIHRRGRAFLLVNKNVLPPLSPLTGFFQGTC